MSNSLLLRRRLLLDNNKNDLGYVANGLVFQIDGIFNTKNGNDKTSNVWEDLVGDNFVPIGSNTWGLNCLNCSSNMTSNKVIPDLGENCTMEIVYKYEGETYHQCGLKNGAPRFKGRHDAQTPWWQHNGSLRVNYTSPLAYNTFYSVATTRSANVCKAFLNGILKTTSTLNLTENSGNSLLDIGAGAETMKGKVYAIRLYNRALTDEELLKNYNLDVKRFVKFGYNTDSNTKLWLDGINNSGLDVEHSSTLENGWFDLSGNCDPTPLGTGNTVLDNCVQSNGTTNGIMTVPTLDPINFTGDLTLELVFKRSSGKVNAVVFGRNYKNSYYLNTANTNLTSWLSGKGVTLANTIPNGQKCYVQVVFENSTGLRKIYINGQLLSSNVQTAKLQTSTSLITIFGYANGAFLQGNLYAARLHNKALTENELLQNYNIDNERFGE